MLFKQGKYLGRFRETPFLLFGENFLAVNGNRKNSAGRSNKLNLGLAILSDGIFQTGGLGQIVSGRAIFNNYLQLFHLYTY